jgi:GT2 family glycosyltransferase
MLKGASPPFVSIVVPALNAESYIKDCLISILQTNYPPERREILVVDNGSTDRTAEIIKSFPARYFLETQRGVSFVRNKGIKVSGGEIVAFTDADCVVSKDWLRELIRGFDEKEVGGVAGEIVAYLPRTPAERYAARVRHLSPQKYLSRPQLPFAVFANLAFRREVFDRVGLLDEAFLSAGESTDFCTRFLRETGLSLKYVPKAVVFHRHRRTAKQFFKQQWNYGRSHALLYIKYREQIPWGWRQSVSAYRDLARSAWTLAKSGLHVHQWRQEKEEIYFHYFEFLKKLAERLGFIRESIARGYLFL